MAILVPAFSSASSHSVHLQLTARPSDATSSLDRSIMHWESPLRSTIILKVKAHSGFYHMTMGKLRCNRSPGPRIVSVTSVISGEVERRNSLRRITVLQRSRPWDWNVSVS